MARVNPISDKTRPPDNEHSQSSEQFRSVTKPKYDGVERRIAGRWWNCRHRFRAASEITGASLLLCHVKVYRARGRVRFGKQFQLVRRSPDLLVRRQVGAIALNCPRAVR